MLDIGLPEVLMIMAVVLLVFGPGKLPEVGRGLGRAIGEFRRFTSGAGILDALEQPPARRPAEMSCVTCGAPNPAANRFCGNCGREMANESAVSRTS